MKRFFPFVLSMLGHLELLYADWAVKPRLLGKPRMSVDYLSNRRSFIARSPFRSLDTLV